MRILICILFFPFIAAGQKIFSGSVLNKNTTSGISYATIGLIKENIGVNADENGHFILKSQSPKPGDSLVISSVGFVTQKIAVTNNLDSNIDIQLVEQITILKDVVVTPNYNWTSIVLNDYSDCGNSFFTSNGYLQQLAQHFVAPTENTRLSKVRFCRMTGGIFNPMRTILRIRIYDIDTLTGGPGKDLCDKIIEVKSQNSSINYNLEKYKIIIPNKDFFVAIEWMKIPYNEQKGPKINGSDTAVILYTPSVGCKDIDDSQPGAWQLNYNGKWHPLVYYYSQNPSQNSKRKSIVMSVMVKY